MQISIYYQEEDQYLLDKVQELAKRERRSKSATMLSILEEYFEAGKSIGEILKDMQALDSDQLQESLSIQKENKGEKKLGEILLEKHYVSSEELERAIVLQNSLKNRRASFQREENQSVKN